MKPLYDLIDRNCERQSASLKKHLLAADICEWGDITDERLYRLVDELKESVAPSSGKVLCATLASFLKRYADKTPSQNYRDILSIRGDKPIKTFLSTDEIERFERVETETAKELFVKNCFLVGLKTGMRYGDIRKCRPENIVNGYLTYSSQKTHIISSVPCSERTAQMIKDITASHTGISISGYNLIVKRLAERAGITEMVSIHKGGKDMIVRKCDALSSHSARISLCTNLSILGTPTQDIKRIAGHTSEGMTERYICNHEINLNEQSLNFLK